MKVGITVGNKYNPKKNDEIRITILLMKKYGIRDSVLGIRLALLTLLQANFFNYLLYILN